jgi:hypothetical protein
MIGQKFSLKSIRKTPITSSKVYERLDFSGRSRL